VGGLENGLINLINHMPPNRYRHAIVCLAGSTAYSERIRRDDVRVFQLRQRKGSDLRVHQRFFKLMRNLRPAIVHTRNLPALEFQIIAALAGVRARVHGEHGRDVYDLDGVNVKYNLLRKTIRPFVRQYTAVSKDLARWLVANVGVRPDRVNQIYNGVDFAQFKPRGSEGVRIYPEGFVASNSFVVGTVGRLEAVKDQLTLVRAFLHLMQERRDARERVRLVVIGDGSLRQPAMELLRDANLQGLAWLPGERKDIAEIMRAMDLFVLPSLGEGISNTILEAMATGLAVVATNVGGNSELVDAGETGELVPHSNPAAMAEAISNYFSQPGKMRDHGRNARRKVERQFSMEAMVNGYLDTYDNLLYQRHTKTLRHPTSASL
jgi:sugar transferase (PEP-CTERM/EpsH1 system associated)